MPNIYFTRLNRSGHPLHNCWLLTKCHSPYHLKKKLEVEIPDELPRFSLEHSDPDNLAKYEEFRYKFAGERIVGDWYADSESISDFIESMNLTEVKLDRKPGRPQSNKPGRPRAQLTNEEYERMDVWDQKRYDDGVPISELGGYYR